MKLGNNMKDKLIKHIIYGLFDPNTKELKYIGYTSNQTKRYYEHHAPSQLKSKTYKNNWLKGLLANKQKAVMIVLEILNIPSNAPIPEQKAIWKDAETKAIAYYRMIGCALTNATDGGEGQSRGYIPSKEAIQKMSEKLKGNKYTAGKKRSDASKFKMSIAQIGRKHTEETKKKMSLAAKGNTRSKGKSRGPFTEQHKQNISLSKLGKKLSEEHIKNLIKARVGRTWKLINGVRVYSKKDDTAK